MSRARTFIACTTIAVTALALTACSSMSRMEKGPAQADQNPAHQMHYSDKTN